MYKGSTRVRTVEVRLGAVLAATWTSSGTTDGFESIDLTGYSGRYLTVMTLPDDSQWLSIVEVSWVGHASRRASGSGSASFSIACHTCVCRCNEPVDCTSSILCPFPPFAILLHMWA